MGLEQHTLDPAMSGFLVELSSSQTNKSFIQKTGCAHLLGIRKTVFEK